MISPWSSSPLRRTNWYSLLRRCIAWLDVGVYPLKNWRKNISSCVKLAQEPVPPWKQFFKSLIQVASVNEGWNPATLAWNNAPLVKENISRTVVNTVSDPTPYGQPYSWDVSKALADAYAAGQPLRLVFYSSDSAYNTGKYF